MNIVVTIQSVSCLSFYDRLIFTFYVGVDNILRQIYILQILFRA